MSETIMEGSPEQDPSIDDDPEAEWYAAHPELDLHYPDAFRTFSTQNGLNQILRPGELSGLEIGRVGIIAVAKTVGLDVNEVAEVSRLVSNRPHGLQDVIEKYMREEDSNRREEILVEIEAECEVYRRWSDALDAMPAYAALRRADVGTPSIYPAVIETLKEVSTDRQILRQVFQITPNAQKNIDSVAHNGRMANNPEFGFFAIYHCGFEFASEVTAFFDLFSEEDTRGVHAACRQIKETRERFGLQGEKALIEKWWHERGHYDWGDSHLRQDQIEDVAFDVSIRSDNLLIAERLQPFVETMAITAANPALSELAGFLKFEGPTRYRDHLEGMRCLASICESVPEAQIARCLKDLRLSLNVEVLRTLQAHPALLPTDRLLRKHEVRIQELLNFAQTIGGTAVPEGFSAASLNDEIVEVARSGRPIVAAYLVRHGHELYLRNNADLPTVRNIARTGRAAEYVLDAYQSYLEAGDTNKARVILALGTCGDKGPSQEEVRSYRYKLALAGDTAFEPWTDQPDVLKRRIERFKYSGERPVQHSQAPKSPLESWTAKLEDLAGKSEELRSLYKAAIVASGTLQPNRLRQVALQAPEELEQIARHVVAFHDNPVYRIIWGSGELFGAYVEKLQRGEEIERLIRDANSDNPYVDILKALRPGEKELIRELELATPRELESVPKEAIACSRLVIWGGEFSEEKRARIQEHSAVPVVFYDHSYRTKDARSLTAGDVVVWIRFGSGHSDYFGVKARALERGATWRELDHASLSRLESDLLPHLVENSRE